MLAVVDLRAREHVVERRRSFHLGVHRGLLAPAPAGLAIVPGVEPAPLGEFEFVVGAGSVGVRHVNDVVNIQSGDLDAEPQTRTHQVVDQLDYPAALEQATDRVGIHAEQNRGGALVHATQERLDDERVRIDADLIAELPVRCENQDSDFEQERADRRVHPIGPQDGGRVGLAVGDENRASIRNPDVSLELLEDSLSDHLRDQVAATTIDRPCFASHVLLLFQVHLPCG